MVQEEEEEDDDGNVSDPPPMEYDANRDREINEDPDQSDGGDGAGGPDEEVRVGGGPACGGHVVVVFICFCVGGMPLF